MVKRLFGQRRERLDPHDRDPKFDWQPGFSQGAQMNVDASAVDFPPRGAKMQPMKKRTVPSLFIWLFLIASCVSLPEAVPAPATVPVPTAVPAAAGPTPEQSAGGLTVRTLTAPTATPAAAPAAKGTSMQPLSPETCTEFAQGMAKVLNVEVTQAEAPFMDPATREAGTGCQARATGTGEQFQSPQTVVTALAGLLISQGWKEDPKLAAGGPTGTASGFRKGDQVCLAGARWQPESTVNCRSDKPIATCEVAPEQQLYTVTLDCAQR
jgi:hypothetical protein